MKRLMLSAPVGVLLILAVPGPGSVATTIDPLTWEQLVLEADLLGVLECVTAGGIVARFRVVDSWKGPANGTCVRIRMALNYWGQQFPIALCGKRYLVAAFASEVPDTVVSASAGGNVPLWWRSIPADYDLLLSQGFEELGCAPAYLFGSGRQDLASFRSAALSLLKLGPEEREVLLLRKLARKYVLIGKWAREPENAKAASELLDAIDKETDTRKVISQLSRFVKGNPGCRSLGMYRILSQAGGPAALAMIEGSDPAVALPGRGYKEYVVRDIRERLGLSVAERKEPEVEITFPHPGKEELGEMRLRLAGDSWEACDLETLIRHDPGFTAAWLAAREPAADDLSAHGYELASYFAWRCAPGREEHLRVLLDARDPYIRVAGAVYLCFEDEEAGTAKLRRLTKLKGVPGDWAALTLVRRGHAKAMPRALRAFAPRESGKGVPAPPIHLGDRLRVLLSNAAMAGGVPQPSPIYAHELQREWKKPVERWPGEVEWVTEFEDIRAAEKRLYRSYVRWWKANRKRAVLRDPWLPILEGQKTD